MHISYWYQYFISLAILFTCSYVAYFFMMLDSCNTYCFWSLLHFNWNDNFTIHSLTIFYSIFCLILSLNAIYFYFCLEYWPWVSYYCVDFCMNVHYCYYKLNDYDCSWSCGWGYCSCEHGYSGDFYDSNRNS